MPGEVFQHLIACGLFAQHEMKRCVSSSGWVLYIVDLNLAESLDSMHTGKHGVQLQDA